MADSGDFSRSVTKIDRMQHLAAMPLDDAEASWEEYAAVRKIIIIYLQVVGLWDYVVDFAAATRGVPWAVGGCDVGSCVSCIIYIYIAGPGINPPHVDASLVTN